MSVEEIDTDLDVSVDTDANRAEVIVTQRVLVEDLFDDDGELRLWEDPAGWSGYRREETDGGVRYYHVNTRHDSDDWIRNVRVGEAAVRDAVRDHIDDPAAGERGRFIRGATRP